MRRQQVVAAIAGENRSTRADHTSSQPKQIDKISGLRPCETHGCSIVPEAGAIVQQRLSTTLVVLSESQERRQQDESRDGKGQTHVEGARHHCRDRPALPRPYRRCHFGRLVQYGGTAFHDAVACVPESVGDGVWEGRQMVPCQPHRGSVKHRRRVGSVRQQWRRRLLGNDSPTCVDCRSGCRRHRQDIFISLLFALFFTQRYRRKIFGGDRYSCRIHRRRISWFDCRWGGAVIIVPSLVLLTPPHTDRVPILKGDGPRQAPVPTGYLFFSVEEAAHRMQDVQPYSVRSAATCIQEVTAGWYNKVA